MTIMKKNKVTLMEISKTFLTIGTIGFGGGLAIIALMQEYCVIRKKWLSIEEFSHGIALGQFLGPFATNASIFIGYRLRGFIGGLTALVFFSPFHYNCYNSFSFIC
jgi:chromate transporter